MADKHPDKKKTAMLSSSGLSRRSFIVSSAVAAGATLAPGQVKAGTTHSKPHINWRDWERRVVVIGSGIGGMASGALFAHEGHHVTVLELHPTLIGGHARHPEFCGLKYSMGPQYVWHFEEGDVGDRFLQHLGIQDVTPFARMDPTGFETQFVGSNGLQCTHNPTESFEVPMGLETFRRMMVDRFPDERRNLERLFDDTAEVYADYKHFLDESGMKSIPQVAWDFISTWDISVGGKLKLARACVTSLENWLDQYELSGLVRRVLYGHGGIFLENESNISAMVFIVATGMYHEGSRYPAHGFYTFFDALRSVIEAKGGSVETNKRVVEIEIEDGLATAVRCEDGSRYPCDAVFSNISPRLTNRLVPSRYQNWFFYEPSYSTIACCIGLKGRIPMVQAMKGRNYWYQHGNGEVDYDNTDVTVPPQMIYMSSHTSNGFGNTANNPHDDSLTAFVVGNYQQEQEIYANGPDAVARFKKKLADDIVDLVDRTMLPGVRQHVRCVDIVSTVDLVQETDSEGGNVYGRRFRVREFLKGPPEPLPIDNLYNVSSIQHGAGIGTGVAQSVRLLEDLTKTKV